jgi:hypothetical protein
LRCPCCRQRLPRGDHTICPKCGISLRPNRNQQHKGDEETKKPKEISSSVLSAGLSRLSGLAIAGIIMTVFGFGVILFYPFPPVLVFGSTYEDFLLTALASGIIGMILFAISVIFAFHVPSYNQVKQRGPFTVYDVMKMSLALPSWWKWWYPYVPVIVLFIASSDGAFSGPVYWGLIFGYAFGWTLYLFLVSKRWLRQNR